MLLTKSGGIIVKPISIVLGQLLSWLYDALSSIGIEGIGISIIVFTVFIRLILAPMMVSQNKSSKITAYIQPEIKKIAKKYKGKKDQESMLAQQRETKEIQDKYGVNMTSGCLISLIQLPVFMALYRVMQNIPAYVDKIKDIYLNISLQIDTKVNPDTGKKAFEILENFKSNTSISTLKTVNLDVDDPNTIIDTLAKIPSGQWDDLAKSFNDAGFTDIASQLNTAGDKISHIYDFFGAIDLTQAPGFKISIALIIPILSMVFQYLSMHATPQQPSTDPAQEQTMKSMKTMMNVMPLMSFFITVGVPAGLGLYWATGSLLSFLTTVGINYYFNHCDMEKVIEKSMAKAAKKAEKKKAKGKKSFWDKMQEAAYGQNPEESNNANKVNTTMATKSLKNYSSATSSKINENNGNVQYRKGSLASKANIMQRYNGDNNGGK